MKFLYPEVDLNFPKSTIRPCMEYGYHGWAVSPCCYLEILGELQKQVFRAVDYLLAASFEPMAYCRSVASSSLFCKYYFQLNFFHLNWSNWFHFFVLVGALVVIAIDWMIFQSPFLDVIKMSMSIVPFFTLLNSQILCM